MVLSRKPSGDFPLHQRKGKDDDPLTNFCVYWGISCLLPIAKCFGKCHNHHDEYLDKFDKLNQTFKLDRRAPPLVLFGDDDIEYWQDFIQKPDSDYLDALKNAGTFITFINVGVGGAEMRDIAAYAAKCDQRYEPKAYILSGGKNSILLGSSAEETFEDFKECIRAIKHRKHVFYFSILPAPLSKRYHAEYEKYHGLVQEFIEREKNITYVTNSEMTGSVLFRGDRLHLNQGGYKEWNRKLDEIVQQVNPPPPKEPDSSCAVL
jgi:lysophospholipase L1-like esterase